jgi:uncharacterized OB-fold protein
MTFLEKTTDVRKLRHWDGDMEAQYLYTTGIAGDIFFKGIMNGKIMGSKCEKCNRICVPPRIYCEVCFERLNEYVEVSKKGKIHTYTIAKIDIEDKRLKEPLIWAMIKLDGVDGGMVHKVSEIAPKEVKIGLKVEAKFKNKKERKGSILDIEYFKPVK